MRLLQAESELDEIVKLVGADALSPKERLTLEAARSVREDFLQQNAFDEFDSYTPLDKQYRLLLLILSYYNKSLAAVEKGADAEALADMNVREKIGRAKSAPDDTYVSDFEAIDREIDAEIETILCR